MSPTFTALLQALIAFYALQSFPLAASYSIDNRSCKQYYTDGKDKTSMIQEGMTGAQKMIRNAVGSILRAEYGNTARQMFKDSSLPELTSIQGEYYCAWHLELLILIVKHTANLCKGRYQNIGQSGAWNFIDTPSSLVEAQVYILCGDATFFPNPSSGDYAWFETTSGVTYITDVNHRTNPNDRICGPKSAGITFDALLKDDITSPGPHDYKILVLCDAALYRGGATDTKGSVSSIDSLAALPSNVQGSAGLYHGKTLDNVYFATILSAALLHEMFHVVEPSYCKLLSLDPSHGHCM